MIDNNKNNLKLKPESTKSEEGIVAEELLENFEDYELLADRYSKDGYVVFDPEIETNVIDKVALDTLEILNRPKYQTQNRVQDAWYFKNSIRSLAIHGKILDFLSFVYKRKALPFQTLNFKEGTQQPVHSDAVHFNCRPEGFMCGVWIALEDVTMDNGPLIYYPGTHTYPDFLMDTFNLPQDTKYYRQYEIALQEWIDRKKIKPHYGVMKKGQALVWASNILHGGSEIKETNSTRLSQVTHYYFEGVQPWRPLLGGVDFNPQYIL